MDEKYFNKKIDSILDCFTLWLLNEYCITDAEEDKAKAILHQIAADARREALRDAKAAVDRFDYLFDNIGHERIDKIKAAIEAMGVKP